MPIKRKGPDASRANPISPNNSDAVSNPNGAGSQEWWARVPPSFWRLKIPARPLRTLGILLQHANYLGECFPEIATLARETGTDRTNVYHDLNDLRYRYGRITWMERETTAGHDTSHLYRILLPEFEQRRSGTAATESVTGDNAIVTHDTACVTLTL